MNFTFLNPVFNNAITRAICWTLIHSLWQGLLMALIAGMVIVLTRKSDPAVRYNLLASLFFLFLAVSGVTLFLELGKAGVGQSRSSVFPEGNPFFVSLDHPVAPDALKMNLMQRIAAYFDAHAAVIVAVWFIVLSIRIFRIFTNLAYLQQIRYRKVSAPSDFWQEKFKQLNAILKMSTPILLLESEIVKVPLVIGFLKPAIMMPLGLLANLPPEQIEAILLHELAHIKRKDYFVNLLQSFAEIIFFFNPGALWISHLLRNERENCCDALAVAQTHNKKNYIQALISFHDYNVSKEKYNVPAFPGNKNLLLDRVRRIIFNSNKSLSFMEKTFLISCFFISTSLTVVLSSPSHKNEKYLAMTVSSNKDTVPASGDQRYDSGQMAEGAIKKIAGKSKGNDTYFFKKKSVVYELDKEGGNVTAVRIDGKGLSRQEMESPANQLLIAKMMQSYDRKEGVAGPGTSTSSPEELFALKNESPSLSEREKVVVNQGVTPGSQIITFSLKRIKVVEENNKITQLYFKDTRVPDDKLADYTPYIQKLIAVSVSRASSTPSVNAAGTENITEDPAEAKKVMKDIMTDLVKQSVVADVNGIVSISLTSEDLTVNGTKQPEQVYRFFAEKYTKRIGCNIFYGDVTTSGRGVFLTKDDM